VTYDQNYIEQNGHCVYVEVQATISGGWCYGLWWDAVGYNATTSPGQATELRVVYDYYNNTEWSIYYQDTFWNSGQYTASDGRDGLSGKTKGIMTEGSSGYIDSYGVYQQQTEVITASLPNGR
jgi:hypothetical protein